jgi:hypothetical protein|uniref:Uncharacterized protein n=1 Tax=Globisporangium ultimum (strain ATCC 200006 / CBS 805.95 / DAOM BR144) TaxID=431595 RepID=K3X3A9_GLOUD
MAAATTLPDDFVLEYDLLQFVEDDDHHAEQPLYSNGVTSATSAASLQMLNVDDLLGNSFVGLDTIVDGECEIISGDAATESSTQTAKEQDLLLNVTATLGGDDDLAEFLIHNDEFLHEMEKVVKMDMDTNGCFSGLEPQFQQQQQQQMSPSTSSSSSSASSPRFDEDCDTETFTDADIMSSPCPSSCPSSTNEFMSSPLRGDFDECSLLKQQQHQAWLMAQTVSTQMTPMHHAPTTQLLQNKDQQAIHQNVIDLSVEEETEVEEDCEIEDANVETKVKNDAELLKKEAKYLEAQYDYLLSRAKSSRPQRANIKSKRGRGREAEGKEALVKSKREGTILNELVSQQQVYLDNFKAMLAFAPVNDVRLALMTPMESYIHLGRDFDERRQTILSLREEKLDMTLKYIEQKSQGLNLNQPYQYSDMFEKFGKNYCVNFAISRYDDVGVLAVAGAIYEQIAGKDESLANQMGRLTVRESYDQIRCNFMHQRIVSSMKWDNNEVENMPDVESNALFYSRFADNAAIMATDYIDQDDLHPYQASERIRKDVSSGVVLTGHVDENGRNYVIMKRFLLAKFHMFPHKISQQQQDKFFSSMPMCHDKMKTLIVDKLARNDGGVYAGCTGMGHGDHTSA